MVVSGFIIVGGVIMFAFSKTSQGVEAGLVTVWGTMSEANFTQLKNYLNDEKEIAQTIEYRSINAENFDTIFTTALAEGVGPDIIMITDDKFVRHENKLLQIGYEFYNERVFKDSFIEAGEIFTDIQGVYAFPFLVDPMVMYWNRSLFTKAGVSQPPRYWDELLTLVPRLTEKDEKNVIQKSALAIGEYQNIDHAKELYLTLLMQAGNNVAEKNYVPDGADGAEIPSYVVTFDDTQNYSVAPAIAATNFYTQFANPARSVYTWNRSLPDSRDSFISGDTAIYFGFASEFAAVRQKNPNLNFDVAVMPQSRTGKEAVYGKVLALAMPKSSQNTQRAYPLIQTMLQPDVISVISNELFLPPVRRDLLAQSAENAYMQTFHNSALLAKNIYDFEPEQSNIIFKNIIENVVSGRLDTADAVTRANQELDLLRPIR
jgi:multiple sugar transport system substrate-binding protein